VGGIRFYKPIHIGEIIRVDASVIYTGGTSIHIAVDVFSKKISDDDFEKKTHCIIVFVSVDENGKTLPVQKWNPITEKDKKMEQYAIKLKDLRQNLEEEMKEFLQ
jgi:acyl-CoA hydrolase